jgi:hypothetical protein
MCMHKSFQRLSIFPGATRTLRQRSWPCPFEGESPRGACRVDRVEHVLGHLSACDAAPAARCVCAAFPSLQGDAAGGCWSLILGCGSVQCDDSLTRSLGPLTGDAVCGVPGTGCGAAGAGQPERVAEPGAGVPHCCPGNHFAGYRLAPTSNAFTTPNLPIRKPSHQH